MDQYEREIKIDEMRKEELIKYLRDQLDIAKIPFTREPDSWRVNATIEGRTIRVDIDKRYTEGFSRYTNPDVLQYKIHDARKSTGSWRSLSPRYVKQTKRGREGDAIWCLKLMQEAAHVQIALEVEEKRVLASKRDHEEIEKKRDEQYAPFTKHELYGTGATVEKRPNRGFTIAVHRDDFDLLKKLTEVIRGQ